MDMLWKVLAGALLVVSSLPGTGAAEIEQRRGNPRRGRSTGEATAQTDFFRV